MFDSGVFDADPVDEKMKEVKGRNVLNASSLTCYIYISEEGLKVLISSKPFVRAAS